MILSTVESLPQPSEQRTSPPDSQKPRVSIVIPTYNHSQYVGDAIQSVLNQTYSDYEIIVVDDGSQDDTHEIVARFGSQVRNIWQENQGLSAARNTGIRAANGELIGLLDADDLFEPDFLSTLVSILDANPEADAVYCVAQTVDVANNLLPQRIGKVVPPDKLYKTLLNGGFFPPLCMFAYKYCYEDVGLFDKAFQGCADWDMWLRISNNYVVIGTDKILARYRVVPQSMSSDLMHMLNDRLAVLRRHFRNGSVSKSQTAIQRQAFGHSYLRAAIEYLQRRDIGRGYHYLCEAFKTSPELASQLDVFYELGLGDQPKGFQGDFSTLDLQRSARVLMEMLDQMFNDSQLAAKLKSQRRSAYANAYLALGLLSYGARRFREARHFLLSAIAANPRYGFKNQLWITLVKSLLPVRLVNWLRIRRQMITSKAQADVEC